MTTHLKDDTFDEPILRLWRLYLCPHSKDTLLVGRYIVAPSLIEGCSLALLSDPNPQQRVTNQIFSLIENLGAAKLQATNSLPPESLLWRIIWSKEHERGTVSPAVYYMDRPRHPMAGSHVMSGTIRSAMIAQLHADALRLIVELQASTGIGVFGLHSEVIPIARPATSLSSH